MPEPSTQETSSSRRWPSRALRFSLRLLPLPLLGYALHKSDPSQIRPAEWALGPVFVALVLNLVVATGIKVARWRIALTAPPSFPRAAAAALEGIFISFVVGFGVGDAVRTARLRGHLHSFAQDFGAAMAERAAEFFGLALLVLAAAATGALEPRLAFGLGGGAMALGYLVAVTLGWRLLPQLQRLRRWPKLAIGFHALLSASTARKATLMALCTIANWIVEIAVVWLAFRGFQVDADLSAAFAIVAMVNLVTTVPSGPGNLGTFEAAVVVALVQRGGLQSEALHFALTYHALILLPPALLGGLAYLVRAQIRKPS